MWAKPILELILVLGNARVDYLRACYLEVSLRGDVKRLSSSCHHPWPPSRSYFYSYTHTLILMQRYLCFSRILWQKMIKNDVHSILFLTSLEMKRWKKNQQYLPSIRIETSINGMKFHFPETHVKLISKHDHTDLANIENVKIPLDSNKINVNQLYY